MVRGTGIRVIGKVPVSVIRLSLAFRWRQGVILDLIQDMVRKVTGETRHEGRLLWTDQIGAT